ncbi:hypothetical protein H5410_033162 [Solanum commersonii]|uniref:PB1-like domain-containing protein n=1 Tax=Solanum commersonii TaxID=4109 RepID=A0A9J5YPZ4_SOLCO|nr:hypothetical protein H5410_033162 [Solanum commersonii]
MEEIIFTKIYNSGILSEISVPTYVGNCVSTLKYIIKDHFSILELLYYTKELGYETVGGFYVKDLLNKKWVLITTDQHLLHLIKVLKHENTFEVFVCHVLDEPLLDAKGPRGYLTNVGGEGVDVNLGEGGETINLGGEGEAVNLGGEGVDVNTGEKGMDDNLDGEGVDGNLRGEGESDFLSSDSDLDIPSKDGSDIDEELRAFRQERRNKKQRKKATEFEEILVEEASDIDRGFEGLGKNKTDKYASFEVKFGEEVHAMSKLGKKEITEDLLYYDPRNWSRAFFQTHSKCDVVENNMCETFNSWILAARHISIITMLEDIRHKMMNIHINMIKFAETWISDIAPMARAILDINKEYSNNCNVQWNGLNGFDISEGEYSFVVDLEKKHCDCRLWMLRGIPFPHAIYAYYYLNQDPDQQVEHWYKKEIFLKAYNHFIQPIPNMRM